jgi:hypothetical protein
VVGVGDMEGVACSALIACILFMGWVKGLNRKDSLLHGINGHCDDTQGTSAQGWGLIIVNLRIKYNQIPAACFNCSMFYSFKVPFKIAFKNSDSCMGTSEDNLKSTSFLIQFCLQNHMNFQGDLASKGRGRLRKVLVFFQMHISGSFIYLGISSGKLPCICSSYLETWQLTQVI